MRLPVVTGAFGGTGCELARVLANNAFDVVVVDNLEIVDLNVRSADS